jgi:NADP-dependent 3-hydroxy acid dehydrogenase YdfG
MSNLVVVVTGASAGIGAALAEQLAREGRSVVLVARRSDALNEIAARCGVNALPVVADMTLRSDVKRTVADAIERFDHIDVWVNNAGQGITRMPTELTDEDIDDMMRINVKSALYGMQEVLPHFKARGRGHIINVSSMLGRMPFAVFRSAYTASKHFLNSLTANFRDELKATHPDIQISLVSPGVVFTEFGLRAKHGGVDSRTLPQGQTPEAVADVIAGVIRSRKPDVYTRPGARQMVIDYYSSLGEDA